MKRDSYQALLTYSFRLLARKNYTESEIFEKLTKRGQKVKLPGLGNAVSKVIARLKELDYINDSKILENYFEYRLRTRPQGKFAFLHEMHRRGIPFDKAAGEWDKRSIEEQSLARELIEKRRENFEGMPPVLKKKRIATLLAGRGFSSETIWEVVDKLGV